MAVRSKGRRSFAPTCQVEFYDPLVTLPGKKEVDPNLTALGGDADVRLGCTPDRTKHGVVRFQL